MALISNFFTSIRRLTEASRAMATIALLALAALLLPSSALAQASSDARWQGIVPDTWLGRLGIYYTTARFVNDSDWDIVVSGRSLSKAITVRRGESSDVATTIPT